MAKGVRRTTSRFGARLEPTSRVALQCYRGRELDTVTQVETLEVHRSLREDYTLLTHAVPMLEAVDQVAPDREPDPALYRMLTGALRTLDALLGYDYLRGPWQESHTGRARLTWRPEGTTYAEIDAGTRLALPRAPLLLALLLSLHVPARRLGSDRRGESALIDGHAQAQREFSGAHRAAAAEQRAARITQVLVAQQVEGGHVACPLALHFLLRQHPFLLDCLLPCVVGVLEFIPQGSDRHLQLGYFRRCGQARLADFGSGLDMGLFQLGAQGP